MELSSVPAGLGERNWNCGTSVPERKKNGTLVKSSCFSSGMELLKKFQFFRNFPTFGYIGGCAACAILIFWHSPIKLEPLSPKMASFN